MNTPLLRVDSLCVDATVDNQLRPIVTNVSFDLEAEGALGIVGESGSGKSMTLRAIQRLLAPGVHVRGEVLFDGTDVYAMNAKQLRRWRSRDIAMIYQDCRAHINPVRTIGDFLTEGLTTCRGVNRTDAVKAATEQLRAVGISDGQRRLNQYPHQLSGGLLQRVMIASALLTDPKLILADEPTTALDVTMQEEVMAILNDLRTQRGLAMILVTHDLELAAAVSDRIAVMYAGMFVEFGDTVPIHRNTLHPYSAGLLASRPSIDQRVRLHPIPGRPRAAYEVARGCRFAERCSFTTDDCTSIEQSLHLVDDHLVACCRAEQLAGQLSLHTESTGATL
ncbi:ABC transporter ATP-binding protein [Rhodococcus sp. NPDC056960]|uniref:ABC transporter ATP-binding protein n=1 Tax=Rhodococcus sp. NPDC056960 TaxID=3345982 RepID=UPI00363D1EC5